jgi:hypothetical protein
MTYEGSLWYREPSGNGTQAQRERSRARARQRLLNSKIIKCEVRNERDATGSKPGDFIERDGKIFVSVVMPVKVGNDEYETKLRWHIAGAKELRRWRRLQ